MRAIGAIVEGPATVGRLASVLSGLAALVVVLAVPVSSAQAGLATDPVPYMGWNTYYGVGGVFNEAMIKSVAGSLVSSGLAATRSSGLTSVGLRGHATAAAS
jgi:alpha-galactosidase